MNKQIKDKVILGIDPGTNLMGYGVLHIIDSKPTVVTLGVIDLRKYSNHYLKLGHIHERVQGIIESYLPDEVAIEAPFFGKNVQSMLKRIMKLRDDMTGPFFDATDALAAAYCHYLQLDKPQQTKNYSNWKDFIKKNPNKVIK